MNNIICFLTLRPSILFYNFCKKLQRDNYDIYICIDDNSYNIPKTDGSIKIIKIDNQTCIDAGFKNTVLYFQNKACSRDKALYYFCKNNIDYKYIWFIEEDVFLPHANIIIDLDNKYPISDLLCREFRDIDLDTWNNYNNLTKTIINKIPYRNFKICNQKDYPYAKLVKEENIGKKYFVGMVCVIRLSKTLMDIIYKYANEKNTLFIDEVLFSTLAYQNNLSIIKPIEFNTIIFNKSWDKNDVNNINYLYHPVKNIYQQYDFRNKINSKFKQEQYVQPVIEPKKINQKIIYYRK
jgi:hypothetical protein